MNFIYNDTDMFHWPYAVRYSNPLLDFRFEPFEISVYKQNHVIGFVEMCFSSGIFIVGTLPNLLSKRTVFMIIQNYNFDSPFFNNWRKHGMDPNIFFDSIYQLNKEQEIDGKIPFAFIK
jgi:hypothetical protein